MPASSTVSIIFAELVDLRALPAATVAASDSVEQLLTVAVVTGGRVIRNFGDGVIVAYASTADAVSGAIRMQQVVASASCRRNGDGGTTLRIGVGVGDATIEGDDCAGPPVVEARELCRRARDGQILVTEVVRLLIGNFTGHAISPVGSFDVEGAPTPVSACQVAWSARVVKLLGVPVKLLLATLERADILLQALAAHAQAYPELEENSLVPRPALDLRDVYHRLRRAQDDGLAEVDLELEFAPGADGAAVHRLGILDEADRLAREGNLPVPPPLPEVRACRRWFLGEIALQVRGGPATRWSLPPLPAEHAHDHMVDSDDRTVLEALGVAVVVASESNQILYVNPAACDLLGWEDNDLVGARLAVLIPPALREAHLAAFTRFLVTGQTSVLGHSVQLPALRKDGSEVHVTVIINAFSRAHRGRAFAAALLPGPDA